MSKVTFDGREFDLAEEYVEAMDETVKVAVIKGDRTFDEVCEETPCDTLKVYDAAGSCTATYKYCRILLKAELVKNYTIGQDPDTGDSVEGDIVRVTLKQASSVERRVDDLEDTVDIIAETILG